MTEEEILEYYFDKNDVSFKFSQEIWDKSVKDWKKTR